MILGLCSRLDEATLKAVKDIGYRYIETWLPGLCGDENNEKFVTLLRVLEKNKLRCEVGQMAFPGVYDPEGRQTEEALEKIRIKTYELIKATSDLNIEKLVIGAGGARVLSSPDQFSNVMEQMADILKNAVSPALDRFGVIAVIEGLVKNESTILNTTDQSVQLAKMANAPNIKVMVDLYHAANEDEDFNDFAKHSGYIMHSHIGKPVPRVMPSSNDGYDYAPFFAALRSAGFNGRMSVEAGLSDPDYITSIKNAYIALEALI